LLTYQPDFLNAIYMNTRGGVSKAQKGLHLNEDIYAGMNAFGRGGRIKHSEYYQCGKGRDLGFGTILNFQTKIGTGMGEQMLSREYYYLGTQLSMDRFLTFYYGHPGFHINNIVSIQFARSAVLTSLACHDVRSGLHARVGLPRHLEQAAVHLQVLICRKHSARSIRLLQLGTRLQVDQAVHHFHLPRVLDRLRSTLLAGYVGRCSLILDADPR
jgi:hypothetical protein